MKKCRKLLSLLIAFAMMLNMVPFAALADYGNGASENGVVNGYAEGNEGSEAEGPEGEYSPENGYPEGYPPEGYPYYEDDEEYKEEYEDPPFEGLPIIPIGDFIPIVPTVGIGGVWYDYETVYFSQLYNANHLSLSTTGSWSTTHGFWGGGLATEDTGDYIELTFDGHGIALFVTDFQGVTSNGIHIQINNNSLWTTTVTYATPPFSWTDVGNAYVVFSSLALGWDLGSAGPHTIRITNLPTVAVGGSFNRLALRHAVIYTEGTHPGVYPPMRQTRHMLADLYPNPSMFVGTWTYHTTHVRGAKESTNTLNYIHFPFTGTGVAVEAFHHYWNTNFHLQFTLSGAGIPTLTSTSAMLNDYWHSNNWLPEPFPVATGNNFLAYSTRDRFAINSAYNLTRGDYVLRINPLDMGPHQIGQRPGIQSIIVFDYLLPDIGLGNDVLGRHILTGINPVDVTSFGQVQFALHPNDGSTFDPEANVWRTYGAFLTLGASQPDGDYRVYVRHAGIQFVYAPSAHAMVGVATFTTPGAGPPPPTAATRRYELVDLFAVRPDWFSGSWNVVGSYLTAANDGSDSVTFPFFGDGIRIEGFNYNHWDVIHQASVHLVGPDVNLNTTTPRFWGQEHGIGNSYPNDAGPGPFTAWSTRNLSTPTFVAGDYEITVTPNNFGMGHMGRIGMNALVVYEGYIMPHFVRVVPGDAPGTFTLARRNTYEEAIYGPIEFAFLPNGPWFPFDGLLYTHADDVFDIYLRYAGNTVLNHNPGAPWRAATGIALNYGGCADYNILLTPSRSLDLDTGIWGRYDPTALAQDVTITNHGNNAATNLTVALYYTGPTAFSIIQPVLTTLTGTDSTTFTVEPMPGLALGTYSATLRITGDVGIVKHLVVTFEVREFAVGAPIIIHVPYMMHPGDVGALYGGYFSTAVNVAILPLTGFVGDLAAFDPATAPYQIAPLNAREELVQFEIPHNIANDVYAIWVQNNVGWSRMGMTNQADPYWINEHEIYAGQRVFLAGRNFVNPFNRSAQGVQVRLVPVGGGITLNGIVYDLTDYMLHFRIPTGVVPGVQYDIWVSNGRGGEHGFTTFRPCPREGVQRVTAVARNANIDFFDNNFDLNVAWLRYVDTSFKANVMDFGATGDGVTNDTAAINDAIAAINARGGLGGILYFPAGEYVFNSFTTGQRTVVMGDGPEESVLIWSGDRDNTSFRGLWPHAGGYSGREFRLVNINGFESGAFDIGIISNFERQAPLFLPDASQEGPRDVVDASGHVVALNFQSGIWQFNHGWGPHQMFGGSIAHNVHIYVYDGSGVHFFSDKPAILSQSNIDVSHCGVYFQNNSAIRLMNTTIRNQKGANIAVMGAVVNWFTYMHPTDRMLFYNNRLIGDSMNRRALDGLLVRHWAELMGMDTEHRPIDLHGDEILFIGNVFEGTFGEPNSNAGEGVTNQSTNSISGRVTGATANSLTTDRPLNWGESHAGGMYVPRIPFNIINGYFEVVIIGGRGLGQVRRIMNHNVPTGTVYICRPWDIMPNSDSIFAISENINIRNIWSNNIYNARTNKGSFAIYSVSVDHIMSNNIITEGAGIGYGAGLWDPYVFYTFWMHIFNNHYTGQGNPWFLMEQMASIGPFGDLGPGTPFMYGGRYYGHTGPGQPDFIIRNAPYNATVVLGVIMQNNTFEGRTTHPVITPVPYVPTWMHTVMARNALAGGHHMSRQPWWDNDGGNERNNHFQIAAMQSGLWISSNHGAALEYPVVMGQIVDGNDITNTVFGIHMSNNAHDTVLRGNDFTGNQFDEVGTPNSTITTLPRTGATTQGVNTVHTGFATPAQAPGIVYFGQQPVNRATAAANAQSPQVVTGSFSSPYELPADGGVSVMFITGEYLLEGGVTIAAFMGGVEFHRTHSQGRNSIAVGAFMFPENTTNDEQVYEIRISTNDGVTWLPYTATVTVPIAPVLITGVDIDQPNSIRYEGETMQLTTTISPANATQRHTVGWSSSDLTIATIDPATGIITAVSVGVVIVTTIVVLPNGHTFTDEITFTVVPSTSVLVDGVVIDQADATRQVGQTIQLTATASPANATETYTIAWSTSNPGVATVNATTGLVTAVAEGTATITVTVTTAGGLTFTDTFTITVTPATDTPQLPSDPGVTPRPTTPPTPPTPTPGPIVDSETTIDADDVADLLEEGTNLVVEAKGEDIDEILITVTIPNTVLNNLVDADDPEDVAVEILVVYADGPNQYVVIDISIMVGNEVVETLPGAYTVAISLYEIGFDLDATNTYRIVALLPDGTLIGGVYDSETGLFIFEADISGEFIITYVRNIRRLRAQMGSFDIIDMAANVVRQEMDVTPIIVNNRMMLPLRFVAYALGAEVDWTPASSGNPLVVYLTYEGRTLRFAIGELVPGMDVPAQIVQNRTMVPLRFISEFFDAVVTWDAETRTAEILHR